MIALTETTEGVVVTVKVVAGSSKTCLAGPIGSMLKVKVAAAAEKGKANECLIEYLADLLRIRKNSVMILSGLTSPVKQIQFKGITSEDMRHLLKIDGNEKRGKNNE